MEATLYWNSADGQGTMDMGTFEVDGLDRDQEEAKALNELIAQCGTTEDADAIRAGSFEWTGA